MDFETFFEQQSEACVQKGLVEVLVVALTSWLSLLQQSVD